MRDRHGETVKGRELYAIVALRHRSIIVHSRTKVLYNKTPSCYLFHCWTQYMYDDDDDDNDL